MPPAQDYMVLGIQPKALWVTRPAINQLRYTLDVILYTILLTPPNKDTKQKLVFKKHEGLSGQLPSNTIFNLLNCLDSHLENKIVIK